MFALLFGMTGRPSTEGSENKHHHLNELKRTLASISQTKDRTQKLSQRQQIYLLPGIISERIAKIHENSVRTEERGPQKTLRRPGR